MSTLNTIAGTSLGIRAIMVANRGEIALRVFRTARRLGLRTIAIYTDVDAAAPHVRAAHVAVRVPSYLDVDEVVAAALATGAEAVHPGYGFLSERAVFADALQQKGITLVGPSARVMEAMGRKDLAREVAIASGVPVVPSYPLAADPDDFAYPVLVKAAAGGGGKGTRVVRSAVELPEAVAAARREATNAFGDDTLLVEKYVESARHVEVQIIGDAQGAVLHLWERDCSSQRRHQKVLEEAPAPTIDANLRERLTAAAVGLAREVNYVGAGTVEFILDNATGDFYFLEMNTRLQVEHPVTEAVTGLDLVELQLIVADGQPLPLKQSDVTCTGHAIEARVYAEDAFGGFLPQGGTASYVYWPDDIARVDHALETGQTVSTAYDPMLGKIIVHAESREAARLGLIAAIDQTAIMGITTNTGFLRVLLATDEFGDATIDTAWLDHHLIVSSDVTTARALAAWVIAGDLTEQAGTPFTSDGFRLGSAPAAIRILLDRPVLVEPETGLVDGLALTELWRLGPTADERIVRITADVEAHGRVCAFLGAMRRGAEVIFQGQRHLLVTPDRTAADHVRASDGSVVAPMPGTVLQVRVNEGQHVERGEVLALLEAMKMELALVAPCDGVVSSVDVGPGVQVSLGALIVRITGVPERGPSPAL